MSAATKADAEALFKQTPKQEQAPGRRTHVDVEAISDAELERRLIELQEERRRRLEENREKMVAAATHDYEKDKEDALRLIRKVYEAGGIRDDFIEAVSRKDGVFSPHLIFSRDTPEGYLPEELRGEGPIKKASGRSAPRVSEPAPLGESGETARDAVIRVVNESKGKEITKADIINKVTVDPVFRGYHQRQPNAFNYIISGAARSKAFERTGKDIYRAVE